MTRSANIKGLLQYIEQHVSFHSTGLIMYLFILQEVLAFTYVTVAHLNAINIVHSEHMLLLAFPCCQPCQYRFPNI